MKKPITIKLEEKDIVMLETLGGKTRGITFLIEEHKRKMGNVEIDKTPEDRFLEQIIIPIEQNMRAVYLAILKTWIKRGGGMGSIEFWMGGIVNDTGYDVSTVRKDLRKLSASHYLLNEGFLFRPVIRLKDEKNIDMDTFKEIFYDYHNFLRIQGNYKDIVVELMPSGNIPE